MIIKDESLEKVAEAVESTARDLRAKGLPAEKYEHLFLAGKMLRMHKGEVNAFVNEVERRAEQNMLKTGKLEGAHYAAMKQLQAEINAEGEH